MKRVLAGLGIGAGVAALVTLGAGWSATAYYSSQRGQGCASCHEMAAFVTGVHGSAHRGVTCTACHVSSVAAKLRHVRVHLLGDAPEAIRLRDTDAAQMSTACAQCHEEEYAAWHAGPHSATYAQIFTNAAQNHKQRLMEDCFRCHGMHFDGAMRDLVQPVDTRGPWRMKRAELANEPAIPCLACHWIHREGEPAAKPAERISVAGEPVHGTLAFFDRREPMHFAAATLRVPQVYDGARAVRMSADARQGLCYQCHAPRIPDAGTEAAAQGWGVQAGSGDDRTPMGVHEGLSCLACHNGHNENARASCKTCHGAKSECGLDVESMDTTYANAKSAHNIHRVRCVDCHQHGVPRKTVRSPQ